MNDSSLFVISHAIRGCPRVYSSSSIELIIAGAWHILAASQDSPNAMNASPVEPDFQTRDLLRRANYDRYRICEFQPTGVPRWLMWQDRTFSSWVILLFPARVGFSRQIVPSWGELAYSKLPEVVHIASGKAR